ncbi:MAG: hypothetical protein BYD32DRAFT_275818 [Podila humilis]|nr:MAG: hypothetical protein BYD32DRAFT_275818 [Podila humilis]
MCSPAFGRTNRQEKMPGKCNILKARQCRVPFASLFKSSCQDTCPWSNNVPLPAIACLSCGFDARLRQTDRQHASTRHASAVTKHKCINAWKQMHSGRGLFFIYFPFHFLFVYLSFRTLYGKTLFLSLQFAKAPSPGWNLVDRDCRDAIACQSVSNYLSVCLRNHKKKKKKKKETPQRWSSQIWIHPGQHCFFTPSCPNVPATGAPHPRSHSFIAQHTALHSRHIAFIVQV